MKAVCAFCGFRNKSQAANCAQCGQTLAHARREKFRVPWASWVPIIPVAFFVAMQSVRERQKLSSMEIDHRYAQVELIEAQTVALQKLEENFTRTEAEEEAKHQSLLRDGQIISGQKAAERHTLEWSRRHKHDPAFVSTLLEQTLVEVEKLGADPNLTAETSLKHVAEKVCPPGSRIEVTPSGNRFTVRVAFRLSSVAPMEAGTYTRHETSAEMRRQVEQATARLIQAIFDYCGSRGIDLISVSCNRALVSGERGAERLHMRSLYRASIDAANASAISNWRTTPLTQITRLLKVEHDMLNKIVFDRSSIGGLALDPNEPLEF